MKIKLIDNQCTTFYLIYASKCYKNKTRRVVTVDVGQENKVNVKCFNRNKNIKKCRELLTHIFF